MKRLLTMTMVAVFAAASVAAQEADYSKMSPMLQQQAKAFSKAAKSGMRKAQAEAGAVAALVKINGAGEQALTRQGCIVLDRIDDLCIAVMPVDRLARLSADSRIVYMEAHPASKPMTDSLGSCVNIAPIYNGLRLPQAYTGKGVLVGIADTGFDYLHPMFADANGVPRIKMAWDPTTGLNDGYAHFGSTYTTAEQLLKALGSGDSIQHHGTHVAGIAAGSRIVSAGNRVYSGVASEADIALSVALINGLPQDKIANINKTISQIVMATADSAIQQVYSKKIDWGDCIEFLAIRSIIDHAKANHMPCVVNCSFGGQETLVDDRSLEQEFFNKLAGPGQIIVASAGNDADCDIYHVKEAGETLKETLWIEDFTPEMTLRSNGDFKMTLSINVEGLDQDFVFESKELDFDHVYADSAYRYIQTDEGQRLVKVRYIIESTPLANGMTGYTVHMLLPDYIPAYYRRDNIAPGHIDLTIESDSKVEVMGQWAKLAFNRMSKSGYVTNGSYTVGCPAMSKDVIAVGLTSHRDSLANIDGQTISTMYNKNEVGRVVSWSGTGPTLDGRIKPDITAPGYNIVSALNSQLVSEKRTSSFSANIIDRIGHNGADYYMLGESGTSMSGPVVSGIIALWLQADPTLTPDRIKEIMSETARHPEEDIEYPNNRYGYGEIDAYRGLLKILNIPENIESLSTHQPQQATFRLDGRTLHIDGTDCATISIYHLNGQLLKRVDITDGTVDLSTLSSGVYAVQMDTRDSRTTGSTLIRL